MELFTVCATLKLSPSATCQLVVYYMDSRQDSRFCFLSKLMFYRVDINESITLARCTHENYKTRLRILLFKN